MPRPLPQAKDYWQLRDIRRDNDRGISDPEIHLQRWHNPFTAGNRRLLDGKLRQLHPELDREIPIREPPCCAATRKALHAVLAEQAQLAGWAAFDAGWFDRSTSLYAASRAAATEADDDGLYANALALEAYQYAFDGRPDVGLAEASCAAVTERVPARVRALIFDRAAFTLASAGLTSETESVLDDVAEALLAAKDHPSPDWAQWVDFQELDIMTGRCWSALRRPLRAVAPLERALASFPDENARDKALYLLALGEAYAYGGELDIAAGMIARANALTVGVASRRPAMRMRLTLASISRL